MILTWLTPPGPAMCIPTAARPRPPRAPPRGRSPAPPAPSSANGGPHPVGGASWDPGGGLGRRHPGAGRAGAGAPRQLDDGALGPTSGHAGRSGLSAAGIGTGVAVRRGRRCPLPGHPFELPKTPVPKRFRNFASRGWRASCYFIGTLVAQVVMRSRSSDGRLPFVPHGSLAPLRWDAQAPARYPGACAVCSAPELRRSGCVRARASGSPLPPRW